MLDNVCLTYRPYVRSVVTTHTQDRDSTKKSQTSRSRSGPTSSVGPTVGGRLHHVTDSRVVPFVVGTVTVVSRNTS